MPIGLEPAYVKPLSFVGSPQNAEFNVLVPVEMWVYVNKEQWLGKAYSCCGHPTERGVPGWTVPLPAFGRAYLATETFEASPTARDCIAKHGTCA